MIIRKPYAFLIRHFKKIHILLLALCAFIYYKNLQLSSFIGEFMQLQTYDAFAEPISKYASFPAMLSMGIIIVGSLALVILLKHKQKPWKLYLLPIIEYIALFAIFMAATNFFNKYNGIIDNASIRAIRDFLRIASIIQYPIMLIFLIRIFGVDLNKFNFQMDKEYLEMSQEDREELEINVNFDKDSVKRGIRKVFRYLSYFYQEHKLIVNIAATILLILFLYSSYTFIFVINKSYTEGQSLDANGYTITLNNSYYSDKDYAGNIISEDSAFVILDLTIKNNQQMREIDLNKFHIMNGISDYVTTEKTYGTEFQDLGKTYEGKELKNGEEFNLIMIYRVSKEQSVKRFVLYYQEFNNEALPHLRKIKLKLNDLSDINENKPLKLGDPLKFTLKKEEEVITFDEYQILDSTEYTYRTVLSSTGTTHYDKYTAPEGYKILKIPFGSNNFEGKDMIDFSIKYGTINYIDNKNKRSVVKFKNPFGRVYYGKYLYTRVPAEMEEAKSIEIHYTIRDQKYVYKLR